LSDRVQTAIISAAASGIGLAIARGLCADGWQVYVCDQDQDALDALAQTDPLLTALACDVSDAGAVDAFYRAVDADLALRGLSGIDLGAGEEGYKRRFADAEVALVAGAVGPAAWWRIATDAAAGLARRAPPAAEWMFRQEWHRLHR
jgi:NAD(P)-dependent dehydrogenase (short-subunit alcohol dehydrogenase family)